MSTPQTGEKTGAVLVVGGGIAGIQAALDLAESGYYVYLVERKPAIGGTMPMLDKTFPTNDCSMCILSPKLVECGRHLNIKVLTLAELTGLEGEPGNFTATIAMQPRYVDLDKCRACGDCVKACPADLADEFNQGLNDRKGIFKLYAQAFPNAFSIGKTGLSPCRAACPAGVNAQGYIQLIKKGEFQKAWQLIYESIPFPAVCGRVCVHPCQTACYRGKVDDPVDIMFLKRVAADAAYADPAALTLPETAPDRPQKVAVVGAGPAGLAAAYRLRLAGYGVTVFEALPVAGGMLRVGIPEYRLPKKWVDLEIGLLEKLGVEIRLGQKLGRDIQLETLSRDYQAVFLALGAHKGISLGVPGEDLPGVMQGVDFLRRLALREDAPVGKRVAVIGGGNTAMDCARTAVRMGAAKVYVVYRRTEAEITAAPEEIREAKDEGVEFIMLASPVEFVAEGGKLGVLRYIKNRLGEPDASGRRSPVPIPGSEEDLAVDTVLVAVGQQPDTTGIGQVPLGRGRTIVCDSLTLATEIPGVFAGGDAATGPKTVIEAIAAGNRAAESIDRYLNGMDLAAGRTQAVPQDSIAPPRASYDHVVRQKAAVPPEQEVSERRRNFSEVTGPLDTALAQKEAERCLNCGGCAECLECVRACTAEAINHAMQPETLQVQVGAVVLVPGFVPYDPTGLEYYGYGRLPNVVTSMEFERILSASGPFGGHLQGPADGRELRKIAWIQCVGSRNCRIGHGYCSSVCCMYAIKEAVIAKEHSHVPLDTTIFFMDMRTFGKDFEKYYDRARDEQGVRFVRSRIFEVTKSLNEEGRLAIRYADEDGRAAYEDHDMVVLSVGLDVSPDVVRMAERLDIDLNSYRFGEPDEFTPVSSNRSGVYLAGAFAGPRDIPETVMQASAAAGAAGAQLASSRGTLVRTREYPPERSVYGEEPRVGVFVCHCGINIGSVVNVPEVVTFATGLPGVVYAEDNLYTCSQDTQARIKDVIVEHGLNRVVVASCSPRTHEPLFQETLRDAGLNANLFEMANIRDQCSWVHQSQPREATEKAKDLVKMAVAKACLLEPVYGATAPVTREALVVGGGVAGLTAALELAMQGYPVHLVEKTDHLGGVAGRLGHSLKGREVGPFLSSLIDQVRTNGLIKVYTGTTVSDVSGFVGNFTSTLSNGRTVQHGVAVVATGGQEYRPVEYLYGQDSRVMTQSEMAEAMESGDPRLLNAKNVVFIQCVGSREPERPYCSRVCCAKSMRLALSVKEKNPAANVFVLYRDIRTYGFYEDLYTEARRKGVVFVRFSREAKPVVEAAQEGLQVTVREPILGVPLVIDADVVGLAAAILPEDNTDLSRLFKLPLNQEGFFLEAHMKLRPVDFSTDGVFMCGLAHGPKNLEESIAQAKAAAGRAVTVLAKDAVLVEGKCSVVNKQKCTACGLCELVCPAKAITVDQVQRVAVVNEALCKGCGACVASCRCGALNLKGCTDEQIMAMLEAI